MIIAILIVLGLCLGSFVNALVWRIHEQEGHRETLETLSAHKKPSAADKTRALKLRTELAELSILHGRSMCTKCRHTLAWYDLLPVVSWLSVGGKCRYCRTPISWQYPLVELLTAALFVVSYCFWPQAIQGSQALVFSLWLVILTGLMASLIYDYHWMILPDVITFSLLAVAVVQAVIIISNSHDPTKRLLNDVISVLIGGGIFFVLYHVSKGKWIGGGDVKLGWLLGLLVGSATHSLMVIFLAALLGTLFAVPGLISKRLQRTSTIPFGPFLIAAAIITILFGAPVLQWYERAFLMV